MTKTKSHLFQPGQSGNPSGRPKSNVTIRELAKQYTETALQTLVEIVQNKRAPSSARVHASAAILDRGWGKPAQFIESINMGMSFQDYLASLGPPTKEELEEVRDSFNTQIELLDQFDEDDLKGL